MKYIFFFALTVALGACQPEASQNAEASDPYLISDEVFKMKLGEEEVYGVRLKMTAQEKKSYLSYAVRLSKNENVWLDTLYTEVTVGDTVENELIFSEALVSPDDLIEVKAEAISVE